MRLITAVFLMVLSIHVGAKNNCEDRISGVEVDIPFCVGGSSDGDYERCMEDVRSKYPLRYIANSLAQCVDQSKACWNEYLKLVINGRLSSAYDQAVSIYRKRDHLSERDTKAFAALLVLRGGASDLAEAGQMLEELIAKKDRAALGIAAQVAFWSERYDESHKYLRALASDEKNFYLEPLNVMQYAQHYQFGLGVERDVNKARNLYLKVIDQDETGVAHYLLGWLYLEGGEVKDGIELLTESTSMKNVKAAEVMGSLYFSGKYVEVDLDKALRFFKIAAGGGSTSAIYNQSIIYDKLGDYKRSQIAMLSAAYLGDEDAKKILRKNKIDLEKYICDVQDLLSKSDSFLFE